MGEKKGIEAFTESATVERYIGHLSTARGIVRTEIAQKHLEEVVLLDRQDSRLRILDMGCGDGRDSIWLASMGHDVVGVDPSEEMISYARKALKSASTAEPRSGDIEFRVSSLTETAAKHTDEFDLILSHGVMMYESNPKEFISGHVSMLKDGGSLSLLTKNAYALPYRAAGERNYARARELLLRAQSTGNLGLEVESHTIQQIADIAASLGCLVTSWAGVRIFGDSEYEHSFTEELLSLEWESARMDPYRQSGALLHVILHKGLTLDYL